MDPISGIVGGLTGIAGGIIGSGKRKREQAAAQKEYDMYKPVSYTHLTLPTILLV